MRPPSRERLQDENICVGGDTAGALHETPSRPVLLAFAARAGAPGAGSTEQYIFARILIAVINEAGFAYTEDVAGADDIDIAMQKGTNYPKGPLAWADEIGHFTVAGVLRALNETVEDGRYEPAPLFAQAKG